MLEPNTFKLIITSSGNVLLVGLLGFFLSPLIIRLQMYLPKDSQFPSFQSFGTNGLFVDGSTNDNGAGVGIVIATPDKTRAVRNEIDEQIGRRSLSKLSRQWAPSALGTGRNPLIFERLIGEAGVTSRQPFCK